MSQGWGWEPIPWDCWLQPGLPALPDSPFGSSKPTIPASRADHQVHWQEARQLSSGKLRVAGCWLIEIFYVLTWNLLALTNQCFPVQWCAVRNLMISSNCNFDGQNLCWPESHNFLAITKYVFINTNKKAYSVLCSTTVKFARLLLGRGIIKKIPAFRAATLGTHMSLFQPYHCCISLKPLEKHRVPTSEEKTIASLPNEACCPSLIRNRNSLTRPLFILILTAQDFENLFHCFYYYNRKGCLLVFLLHECLRTPTSRF